MELLALCWVLLAGTLLSTSGSSSALREGDLNPITVPMGTAPHSFDDQYVGCEEQAIAVLAYSAAGGMCEKFNAATRQGGLSHQHYLQSYRFKTLHFLLTQALQALRVSQPYCYNVYRGVGGIRFTAQRGMAVRFGQFTSTSLRKEVAVKFGLDTFLVIKTCHGAPIKQFSFYPTEDEMWEKGLTTWEEYRNVVRACRDATRKAKARLELNLAKVIKDNKKGFFKHVNSKRKTRENVGPLLSEGGFW
uniref:NAD(P)(+)--arginine ADP-ribosyltransferase n=1 Tax=Meleagris gallopavo TaxID=9103 RepID=A0A803XVS0_MELGA